MEVVPTVINLVTQSVTTKDGKEVSFSANVEFEVTNAVDNHTKVSDFEKSLRNAAMSHLAKRIRAWTYSELMEGQTALEASLRTTLTTYVKDWGVRINAVGLTDMVLAKQYRLFNSTEVNEGSRV